MSDRLTARHHYCKEIASSTSHLGWNFGDSPVEVVEQLSLLCLRMLLCATTQEGADTRMLFNALHTANNGHGSVFSPSWHKCGSYRNLIDQLTSGKAHTSHWYTASEPFYWSLCNYWETSELCSQFDCIVYIVWPVVKFVGLLLNEKGKKWGLVLLKETCQCQTRTDLENAFDVIQSICLQLVQPDKAHTAHWCQQGELRNLLFQRVQYIPGASAPSQHLFVYGHAWSDWAWCQLRATTAIEFNSL